MLFETFLYQVESMFSELNLRIIMHLKFKKIISMLCSLSLPISYKTDVVLKWAFIIFSTSWFQVAYVGLFIYLYIWTFCNLWWATLATVLYFRFLIKSSAVEKLHHCNWHHWLFTLSWPYIQSFVILLLLC